MNQVKVDRLKEHHKNGHYFTDIEGEKYNEIRRSIEEYGIRDPIKVFQVQGEQGYTVISGHQRLRIARDIGMNTVPVEVVPDLTEKEAEYLLIAENVERRGQAESDPIKKSRIANFLKEYWGIRTERGGDRKSKDILSNDKSVKDISELLGESPKQTQRILKLNSLIPQLQFLVSQGKLGTTAGEQLAYLTKDEQESLLNHNGELSVTVEESKRLRKEIESLRNELTQEKNKSKQIETKIIEKVIEVIPKDVENKLKETEEYKKKVENLNLLLMKTTQEKEEIEKRIVEIESFENTEKRRIEELKLKEEQMKHKAHISIYGLQIKIHDFVESIGGDVFLQGAVASSSFKLKDDVLDSVIALEELTKKLREMLNAEIVADSSDIINIEQ